MSSTDWQALPGAVGQVLGQRCLYNPYGLGKSIPAHSPYRGVSPLAAGETGLQPPHLASPCPWMVFTAQSALATQALLHTDSCTCLELSERGSGRRLKQNVLGKKGGLEHLTKSQSLCPQISASQSFSISAGHVNIDSKHTFCSIC